MKRTLIAFAVVALAGVTYAQAQGLRAEIPFDFTVGSVTLPAGSYKIDTLNPKTLSIYNLSEKKYGCLQIGISTYEPVRPVKPSLVFTRVGESIFLRQVWNGTHTGLAFAKSPAEQELLARGQAAQQVVLAVPPKK